METIKFSKTAALLRISGTKYRGFDLSNLPNKFAYIYDEMTLPNDHYTTIYQLAHFTEFYQDDFKKVLGTDATDSLTELLTQFKNDEKTY